MKYFLEAEIDCKACLDNLLINLLQYSIWTFDNWKKVLFWQMINDKYYFIALEINISTDKLEENIKKMFDDYNIVADIKNEKILNDNEYEIIKKTFNFYQKSFWD